MRASQLIPTFLVLAGSVGLHAQVSPSSTPTAEEIMARVAALQDKAEAERARYVYVQHAHMVSRKGSTIQCEETTDYRVTPSENGSHMELMKLDGKVRHKGKVVVYDRLEPEHGNDADKDGVSITVNGEDDTDRDLVENLRKNLLTSQSKDGINAQLFPLTTKEQKNEVFRLVDRERLNGRAVYRIEFRPRDKSDFGWKGEAFVDVDSYQPVLVTTGLSRRIPFGVRALLGTDLPGLGFTVVYAPQPDGVWFPSTFSTEFKIHVLFFFRRQILLDAQNREFVKTHSESRVLDGVTPVEPESKPQ